MTIVFPRPMPSSGAGQQLFDIQRVDYQSPTANGYVGGVQAGFPLWLATWTLARVSRDRSDEWVAWLRSMRGAQKRFLGRDYARPFPKLFPKGFDGVTRAGGDAFTGAATGWSQTINEDGTALLSLTGMPAYIQLQPTDLIGFKWDAGGAAPGTYGRRTLTSVTELLNADGSGNVQVSVEPPIPALVVPSTAVAHLDYPSCVMALVTSDTKVAPIDTRLVITGSTIAGVQDLRP